MGSAREPSTVSPMLSPPIAADTTDLHIRDVEAVAGRAPAIDVDIDDSDRRATRSASAELTPGTVLTTRFDLAGQRGRSPASWHRRP